MTRSKGVTSRKILRVTQVEDVKSYILKNFTSTLLRPFSRLYTNTSYGQRSSSSPQDSTKATENLNTIEIRILEVDP